MQRSYTYNKYTDPYQETRWANPEEIKDATTRVDLSKETYDAAGIPLMNNGKVAWVDNEDNHSLIFGSTGSKKTRLFVMPMLDIMIRAGESFVVTDPKGELFEKTSAACRKKGYDIVTLNFRDFMKSDSWNPLDLAYNFYHKGEISKAYSALNDLVQAISAPSRENTNDLFWVQTPESLLLACASIIVATAKKEEVNMSSVVNLCLDYGKDPEKSSLSKIATFLHPLSTPSQNLEGVLLKNVEKTRTTVFACLFAMLRIFTLQKDLCKVLSKSSFSMEDIGRKKTAVYLVIPDEKETFHFLVSLFIKQCYETLIGVAQEYPNGQLPVRVNMVLDEFANIPTIDGMSAMITAARSRNIRYYLIIQSMTQLRRRYQEDADTLKGNCANWIFLNSKELDLLRELSEMCGSVTSPQGITRPLISVSQLQRLNKSKGECLIFCQREYPFITNMTDIDDCVWDHSGKAIWPDTSVMQYSVLNPDVLLGNLDETIDKNDESQLLFANESII